MNSEIITPVTSLKLYEKKVMISCPWYREVAPQTAFSFAQLRDRRRTSTVLNFGDAFIAHCRNHIADIFLKSDCEYLLTVDSDMLIPFGNSVWYRAHTGWNIPEPFASFNTLDRLMSHGKTLVGALYFGRQSPDSKPVFNEALANETVAKEIRENCPRDEIRQTAWVGTGAMLISRKVFEDIEKKFPLLARKPALNGEKSGGNWFTSSEHELMEDVRLTHEMLSGGAMTGEKCLKAYAMLDAALTKARNVSGLGVGEDVIFCRRAAQSGHPAFVDLGLRVGHIGSRVF